MPTRAHRRRSLYRLALVACCLVVADGTAAWGQLVEFKSTELRGRIDRPSAQNIWTVGDDNGNGTLDENESFGPHITVGDVFLDNPDYTYIGPESGPQAVAAQTGDGSARFQLNSQFSNYGSTPVDYPDFVELSGRQSLGSQSFARFNGAHLMRVLKFQGDPEFTVSTMNETLEIGYGARFYAGLQEYRLYASGGGIGEFKINSAMESQALGPQVSVKWSLRRGPWQASAEAAAALTYMNIDGDQRGQYGDDLVPGMFNRSLFTSPTQIDNHINEWDVSPAFEAGVRASYDITPTTQCFIRGDALQFGNVRDAEDAIIYALPSMGLQDPGGYDVTVTAASIGIEVRR